MKKVLLSKRKVQTISDIKSLILKEISVLKEAITTHSNLDVIFGKAQKEEFYQEQLRFTNEELRKKDNLIVSLLNQVSKKTDFHFNNVIDYNNNNNNDDNLSHKNNSYAHKNNDNIYSSSDNNKNSHINNSLENNSNDKSTLNSNVNLLKLIKVRSFSGAKVSCMYDHVKPIFREFNPIHIILHVGTN